MPSLSQRIFVFLDAILDTRAGTISRLCPDKVIDILADNYHQRFEDKFKGIDPEVFKDAYAKRDIETLSVSTVTGIMVLLKQLCDVLIEQAITMPFHSGPEIILNTYPYKVDEELSELICKSIAVWTEGRVPVEAVYMTPEEITPEYCKENLSLMIFYEYGDWLNLHLASMEKTNLKEITMYVPALYFSKCPTPKEMEELLAEAPHPFLSLELMVKPVLDFNIIDVRYFSILKPDDVYQIDHFKRDFTYSQTE